jgi:hypothetical protein
MSVLTSTENKSLEYGTRINNTATFIRFCTCLNDVPWMQVTGNCFNVYLNFVSETDGLLPLRICSIRSRWNGNQQCRAAGVAYTDISLLFIHHKSYTERSVGDRGDLWWDICPQPCHVKIHCVRKVHLQKVLQMMSMCVHTGQNPFNFIRLSAQRLSERTVYTLHAA